ncbi:MAG: sodium:solute symporter family protein [Selenomonas sp.]|uniref:sodium:solute symporter family protein n=1 Tax=Selenomonas sp. TaxID=2053611 RepID=UPI0025EAEA9C|nr:sodium:solute symporter family protein [Selenomonas sp.]MCR5757120.1 sodium:solute symporter family protein [Selenomonas sp.]
MDFSMVHFAIMSLTICLVLGGGLYAARSVHSAEGFSLGGRSAGVPMITGSIAGTCVGGGATVGTAQLAGSIGLSAVWFTIGIGLSLLIMGLLYARPLRYTGLETISQYLVGNYGKGAGRFASFATSLGILFSAVASTLPGIGLLIALTGCTSLTAAGILLFLVILYAFFGGMKSASVGGLLKMIILFITLFALGFSAWQGLLSQPELLADKPADFLSLTGIGTESILNNLASVFVGMICTQTYIQAIFSAATPRTAAAGLILASLVAIPIGVPCAMMGIYMQAAHPELPAMLALPAYLLHYASPWMGGAALGGIILGMIGSIAGLSLGMGTMISRDMLEPALHIKNEGRKLLLLRFSVVGSVLLAILIAITHRDSQILFWNYLSMALRGCGVFIPLTLAIFKPQALSPQWALASMVLSLGTAVIAGFIHTAVSPIFIGLGVSLAVVLWGLFRQRHKGQTLPQHIAG